MRKLYPLLGALVLIISCNQGKENAGEDVTSGTDFDIAQLPKKINANAKSNEILQAWPEYNALETSFDLLYNAKNKEDLKLMIEDLIEKQKLLEVSEYPETFNKPQIKSRQKVFKTYVLKVKASLEDRKETMTPAKEMVTAYNALKTQFNVIVNNTLDTTLILDE